VSAAFAQTYIPGGNPTADHFIPRPDMRLDIELEREADGRWIAEIPVLPGVVAYGATEAEARAKVQALALRVLADRVEHGEVGAEPLQISFPAA